MFITKEQDMNLEKELARVTPKQDTLLTIGVFDGVHCGHQQLISHLKKRASREGYLAGIVTFNRHPQEVLSPGTVLPYLTTPGERESLLKNLDIKFIATIPFTEQVAQVSAREFVSLLRKYLRMRGLVIGSNFTLGKDGEGNITVLQNLGEEMGFTVDVVHILVMEGVAVSSTAIRAALLSGDVQMASRLLGRNFSLSGQVVSGVGQSGAIGFPTANLKLIPECSLVGDGVYATKTYVGSQMYPSVTNIGGASTWGRFHAGDKHHIISNNPERIVEVHLLDFGGKLTGREIKIEFLKRLRGEGQFATIEALRTQINVDIEQAKAVLKGM